MINARGRPRTEITVGLDEIRDGNTSLARGSTVFAEHQDLMDTEGLNCRRRRYLEACIRKCRGKSKKTASPSSNIQNVHEQRVHDVLHQLHDGVSGGYFEVNKTLEKKVFILKVVGSKLEKIFEDSGIDITVCIFTPWKKLRDEADRATSFRGNVLCRPP
ncbi:hypothetical protein J6590_002034 [Homalodisca vitripennis]|nr:hypothetical protein J6590_002034 [Homalodisca vitripennis]